MSQSSSRSGKRSRTSSSRKSSRTSNTKNTSAYHAEFVQKMIDSGIYPDGYEGVDEEALEPNNIETIRQALAKSRDSLSPSQFSEDVFTQFRRENRRAKSELAATANVIPYITGSKDRQFETGGDVKFNNVAKFDPNITVLQPDGYYGAKPAQIDLRVRTDLDEHITPSTSKHLPIAPNFFREDKSAKGRADVAQNQAMHDGAVGARGMLHLQNYGNTMRVYDGIAYTISSTYLDGQLKMYATHPGPPGSGSSEPQYYMTQLGAYAMTHSLDTFREGAGAYRNGREWAQQQRDDFIAKANAMARRQSTETISFNTSGNDSKVSSAVVEEPSSSETSADELALDNQAIVKRQRRKTRN